jgi:branched-chain amino acid transport system permease protein
MGGVSGNQSSSGTLAGRGDMRWWLLLIALLVVAGALIENPTLLSLVTIGLVWVTVNSSWNLVLGYAGIFSFGQIAFFATGAYCSGVVNYHFGVSPYATIFLAPIGGALAALAIGLAAIRLRGVYVALVTLAFHELLRTTISTDYSGITGGPNGLPVARYLPGASQIAQARLDYFLALAIMAVTGIILLRLLRSPFGLALVACRDAEHVATARGINRRGYQLSAFVLSGAIAGLAGGYYAHYVGVVAPTIISFAMMMSLFAMIIVGGLGSFWGPVLGTAVISLVTTYLQGVAPQYQSLIVAVILVVMVLFIPKGLAGQFGSAFNRLGRPSS